MKAALTFCGGAGAVTGANFLLDLGALKLLVDCGAVEETHVCGNANFEPFPYEPSGIGALFVTHAHADHIGRIPKLVRDGFRGRIVSTAATKALAAVMFDDALSIMREHAESHGCGLLYERADVERALSLWETRSYHEPLDIGGVEAEFFDAGHIVGSALVRISRGGRSILFTGDLGNVPEPLLNDTEYPAGSHYLVIESVYGDRVHEGRAARRTALKAVIEEAAAKKRTLLIPSFSLERTQVLLYELNDMVESGELKPLPVFLDSPLAARVTDVFRAYAEYMNPAVRERMSRGDDPFVFTGLTVTHSNAASRAIHDEPSPKVIIAGAGMSAGGRIRTHEREYLGDRNAVILFVGYQAPGSLGRRIEEGAKKVTIDGEFIRVHAQIETLRGYSGHADRDELLRFMEEAGASLEEVFVTMGEPRSSLFLAQRAKDFLGLNAYVPQKGERRELHL